MGDTGQKGAKGEVGQQGIQGDTGETGSQGVKGDIGIQGDKGDKGETGSDGLKGDEGQRGPAGAGVFFELADDVQVDLTALAAYLDGSGALPVHAIEYNPTDLIRHDSSTKNLFFLNRWNVPNSVIKDDIKWNIDTKQLEVSISGSSVESQIILKSDPSYDPDTSNNRYLEQFSLNVTDSNSNYKSFQPRSIGNGLHVIDSIIDFKENNRLKRNIPYYKINLTIELDQQVPISNIVLHDNFNRVIPTSNGSDSGVTSILISDSSGSTTESISFVYNSFDGYDQTLDGDNTNEEVQYKSSIYYDNSEGSDRILHGLPLHNQDKAQFNTSMKSHFVNDPVGKNPVGKTIKIEVRVKPNEFKAISKFQLYSGNDEYDVSYHGTISMDMELFGDETPLDNTQLLADHAYTFRRNHKLNIINDDNTHLRKLYNYFDSLTANTRTLDYISESGYNHNSLNIREVYDSSGVTFDRSFPNEDYFINLGITNKQSNAQIAKYLNITARNSVARLIPDSIISLQSNHFGIDKVLEFGTPLSIYRNNQIFSLTYDGKSYDTFRIYHQAAQDNDQNYILTFRKEDGKDFAIPWTFNDSTYTDQPLEYTGETPGGYKSSRYQYGLISLENPYDTSLDNRDNFPLLKVRYGTPDMPEFFTDYHLFNYEFWGGWSPVISPFSYGTPPTIQFRTINSTRKSNNFNSNSPYVNAFSQYNTANLSNYYQEVRDSMRKKSEIEDWEIHDIFYRSQTPSVEIDFVKNDNVKITIGANATDGSYNSIDLEESDPIYEFKLREASSLLPERIDLGLPSGNENIKAIELSKLIPFLNNLVKDLAKNDQTYNITTVQSGAKISVQSGTNVMMTWTLANNLALKLGARLPIDSELEILIANGHQKEIWFPTSNGQGDWYFMGSTGRRYHSSTPTWGSNINTLASYKFGSVSNDPTPKFYFVLDPTISAETNDTKYYLSKTINNKEFIIGRRSLSHELLSKFPANQKFYKPIPLVFDSPVELSPRYVSTNTYFYNKYRLDQRDNSFSIPFSPEIKDNYMDFPARFTIIYNDNEVENPPKTDDNGDSFYEPYYIFYWRTRRSNGLFMLGISMDKNNRKMTQKIRETTSYITDASSPFALGNTVLEWKWLWEETGIISKTITKEWWDSPSSKISDDQFDYLRAIPKFDTDKYDEGTEIRCTLPVGQNGAVTNTTEEVDTGDIFEDKNHDLTDLYDDILLEESIFNHPTKGLMDGIYSRITPHPTLGIIDGHQKYHMVMVSLYEENIRNILRNQPGLTQSDLNDLPLEGNFGPNWNDLDYLASELGGTLPTGEDLDRYGITSGTLNFYAPIKRLDELHDQGDWYRISNSTTIVMDDRWSHIDKHGPPAWGSNRLPYSYKPGYPAIFSTGFSKSSFYFMISHEDLVSDQVLPTISSAVLQTVSQTPPNLYLDLNNNLFEISQIDSKLLQASFDWEETNNDIDTSTSPDQRTEITTNTSATLSNVQYLMQNDDKLDTEKTEYSANTPKTVTNTINNNSLNISSETTGSQANSSISIEYQYFELPNNHQQNLEILELSSSFIEFNIPMNYFFSQNNIIRNYDLELFIEPHSVLTFESNKVFEQYIGTTTELYSTSDNENLNVVIKSNSNGSHLEIVFNKVTKVPLNVTVASLTGDFKFRAPKDKFPFYESALQPFSGSRRDRIHLNFTNSSIDPVIDNVIISDNTIEVTIDNYFSDKDWVGLYYKDDIPGTYRSTGEWIHSLAWKYVAEITNDVLNINNPIVLDTTGLNLGTNSSYKLSFFKNDGYEPYHSTSDFNLTNQTITPSSTRSVSYLTPNFTLEYPDYKIPNLAFEIDNTTIISVISEYDTNANNTTIKITADTDKISSVSNDQSIVQPDSSNKYEIDLQTKLSSASTKIVVTSSKITIDNNFEINYNGNISKVHMDYRQKDNTKPVLEDSIFSLLDLPTNSNSNIQLKHFVNNNNQAYTVSKTSGDNLSIDDLCYGRLFHSGNRLRYLAQPVTTDSTPPLYKITTTNNYWRNYWANNRDHIGGSSVANVFNIADFSNIELESEQSISDTPSNLVIKLPKTENISNLEIYLFDQNKNPIDVDITAECSNVHPDIEPAFKDEATIRKQIAIENYDFDSDFRVDYFLSALPLDSSPTQTKFKNVEYAQRILDYVKRTSATTNISDQIIPISTDSSGLMIVNSTSNDTLTVYYNNSGSNESIINAQIVDVDANNKKLVLLSVVPGTSDTLLQTLAQENGYQINYPDPLKNSSSLTFDYANYIENKNVFSLDSNTTNVLIFKDSATKNSVFENDKSSRVAIETINNKIVLPDNNDVFGSKIIELGFLRNLVATQIDPLIDPNDNGEIQNHQKSLDIGSVVVDASNARISNYIHKSDQFQNIEIHRGQTVETINSNLLGLDSSGGRVFPSYNLFHLNSETQISELDKVELAEYAGVTKETLQFKLKNTTLRTYYVKIYLTSVNMYDELKRAEYYSQKKPTIENEIPICDIRIYDATENIVPRDQVELHMTQGFISEDNNTPSLDTLYNRSVSIDQWNSLSQTEQMDTHSWFSITPSELQDEDNQHTHLWNEPFRTSTSSDPVGESFRESRYNVRKNINIHRFDGNKNPFIILKVESVEPYGISIDCNDHFNDYSLSGKIEVSLEPPSSAGLFSSVLQNALNTNQSYKCNPYKNVMNARGNGDNSTSNMRVIQCFLLSVFSFRYKSHISIYHALNSLADTVVRNGYDENDLDGSNPYAKIKSGVSPGSTNANIVYDPDANAHNIYFEKTPEERLRGITKYNPINCTIGSLFFTLNYTNPNLKSTSLTIKARRVRDLTYSPSWFVTAQGSGNPEIDIKSLGLADRQELLSYIIDPTNHNGQNILDNNFNHSYELHVNTVKQNDEFQTIPYHLGTLDNLRTWLEIGDGITPISSLAGSNYFFSTLFSSHELNRSMEDKYSLSVYPTNSFIPFNDSLINDGELPQEITIGEESSLNVKL